MDEAFLGPGEQKQDQRASWDENAAGWKKWWPVFERAAQTVSDRLVELAQIRPGAYVLDIATGNGEPAITAARAVGASGRVMGVDQSPGMLAIARERAAALGVVNIEFLESDAESLPLPPVRFDAGLCRWGLMFMPDLVATLSAVRRALKPDAKFATAVWNSGAKFPLLTLAADALREILEIKPPPPGALTPTRLADTSILKDALLKAGFTQVAIEPMNVRFEFASTDELVAFRSEVGRARATLAALDPAARTRFREAIVKAARKFEDDKGHIRLDNETIFFSARS